MSQKKMFRILKNTFPALFIVWSVFLTGTFLSDAPPEGFKAVHYLHQMKLFIFYTLFGLITGGLSAGILARKKKKYAYFFENEVKKYSIYFIKCFSISALIIFVLISRELINNPLLFRKTLLNHSFWFSGIFMFVSEKFSPMYFTAFFSIIIVMSIHNLSFNLSIYQGAKRIAGYSAAVIFSILLVFNYGYLNAGDKNEQRNIIFIAVEGLKNRYIRERNIRDKSALSEIKKSSYMFENFYTPAKDPKVSLMASLTSVHPDKGGYYGGYASYGIKDKTVLRFLSKKGYNTGIFTIPELAFRDFEKGHKYSVAFPEKGISTRSASLLDHLIAPVIFNNKVLINFFPEAKYLKEYRDTSYRTAAVNELIEDRTKPFFFIKVIPDYSGMMPFPYNRLAESKNETEAFLTYLNDEIEVILRSLKNSGRFDDTVICIYGLPERGSGLRAVDYKVPFILSRPSYGMERRVRNEYSLLDIIPTALDAAGVKYREDEFDGVSFLAPEFVRQNIFLTDITLLLAREDLYFYDRNGFPSKDLWVEREVYPLMPRSLIRGDYKLNITPSAQGPVYEIFDISKDPAETDDISGTHPITLRRMRTIFEETMNKDFNFRIVNGHVMR